MSVIQFSDDTNSSADLQVWNNAAFDNSDRQSWGSLKSVFADPKASFDSISDKENQGFVMENQKTTPFKPVNRDVVIEKPRIRAVPKVGFQENTNPKRGEKEIDDEIEEIESQISRLSSKLEALRLEKAHKNFKAVDKQGRVNIPAKCVDQKQSTMNKKNAEEMVSISSMSARKNVQRRGLSLGPVEIVSSGGRRGMSMGPTEIFGSIKSKQSMITPSQNRRKSCFLKLQDIDEEKAVAKEFKGKSCSVSPRSRKVAANARVSSRQAVTTIASRKNLKKEDVVISSIQPKNLFKDGERSNVAVATNKNPLRPGRVVASRYSQSTNQASDIRKRSLPENDKDDDNSKKWSLSVGKMRVDLNECKSINTEIRVKKRWEIPSEIVVHGSGDEVEGGEKSPLSLVNLLPRIRVGRCVNESPRDSGPAKKVVELIGRKSFFGNDDEEAEASFCQELSFEEE